MTTVYWDTEFAPTRHDRAENVATICQIAVDEGPVRIYDRRHGAAIIRDHARSGHTIVGHRAPTDIASLGLTPADFPRGWRDTNPRAVLKGAAEGKHEKASSALVTIAREADPTFTMIGKEDYSNPDRVQLSFGNAAPDNLTPEQRTYAEQDVAATRLAYRGQGGDRRWPDEERQTRVAWDVHLMERRGVRLDVPRVQELLGEASAKVRELRGPLVDAGIIQPRGPKKDPWREEAVDQRTVQGLLERAGVTKRPKRRAQDPRPPSELLDSSGETLRETGVPELVALADFKDAEKWVSLVEAFNVGPVARAWWKPIVASGRISAARPNLTQVPKGVLRACVVPSEGNVLVCADYSELEFRAWADVCSRWLGWSDAADAYRAGRSPHLVLAATLTGITYDEAVEAYRRASAEGRKWQPREDAKAGNYGLIGAMGVPRLAATYGLELGRAGQVRNAWRRTWGESRSYFRRIEAGGVGDGRYRVAVPWSGRERLGFYAEAANFIIQATGADIAKEALLRATKAGLPVTMLVHDELVLDVPRGDADEAARLLEACMVEAGQTVCPNVPWTQRAEIRDRWA